MSDQRFPTYEQLQAGWTQMQAERNRLRAALMEIKKVKARFDEEGLIELIHDICDMALETEDHP